MTNRLIVAPRAEADLRDALLWYEQRSTELADDLLRQIEARVELIRHSPQLHLQLDSGDALSFEETVALTFQRPKVHSRTSALARTLAD